MSEKRKNARKKILLVDDNLLTLKMLKKILSSSGYTVFPATSGREALAIARKKHPDLLVLDIMLPDIDGIHVASNLREDPEFRNVPVIFLSSLYEEEVRKMGNFCPGSRYLRKPLNAAQLLEEIAGQL